MRKQDFHAYTWPYLYCSLKDGFHHLSNTAKLLAFRRLPEHAILFSETLHKH